jgi:hypothetical protein
MGLPDFKAKPVIIEPSSYPLQIELVPEKAWGHNLRGLIPGSQWDKIKKAVFGLAGHRCEICRGRGWDWPVECHEKWEFNEKRRLQTLEGLVALCPRCHAAKHLGFAMKNKAPEAFAAIREHIMKVNGLTGEQVDKYIEWAFAIQRPRAKMLWTLDQRWLERHYVFAWSKKAIESNILIRDKV